MARAQIRQRALMLAQQGQAAQARGLVEELIKSDPADALAWFCHGVIEQCLERHEAAIEAYRHALSLEPGLPNANNNLGLLLENQGDLEAAAKCYATAVSSNASFVPALFNSGNVALKLYQWSDAVAWFDRALSLDNTDPKAHFGRGAALRELGRHKEAIDAVMHAIALKPDYAEARNLHGEILLKRGMIAEAMHSFENVLQADPGLPASWFHLGNAHLTRGDVPKARDCYWKAAQLGSNSGDAHYSYSNYLLSLNYLALDPDEIFRAHCEWAVHYAHEEEETGTHSNLPDPERRLRVGYVSGDFIDHPVAIFIKSVLQGHDRNAVEVVGFSNVTRPDETTRLLRSHTDRWHKISQLDDPKASELVRSEGIDILVDLAGHTGGNRLGLFARRSAPVQVTYLGYPNTTGLRAMGYRLTDPVADPPGLTDAWYTEKLVRLPHTFLCYTPPPMPPAVHAPPRERNGHVTFGSVSNLAKISPETLDDWAAVLREVPDSRMILKRRGFRDVPTRDDMLRKFTDRGIRPERIELLPAGQSQDDHLSHYAKLDVVLDTFPYNGTTTSCESLLMGVPVVTRHGRTHVSRVGLSLLTSVGLGEIAGASHEEFVARAVSLAQAPERMRVLRTTLRDRFLGSPACNAREFVRELEQAYRGMWRQWCVGQGAGSAGSGAGARYPAAS